MGYYFHNEHAVSVKTQDIKTVLKTVANRYIGQNPPFGVSYYAYQKNGIRQDKHYRFFLIFRICIRWPDWKAVYMHGVNCGVMKI